MHGKTGAHRAKQQPVLAAAGVESLVGRLDGKSLRLQLFGLRAQLFALRGQLFGLRAQLFALRVELFEGLLTIGFGLLELRDVAEQHGDALGARVVALLDPEVERPVVRLDRRCFAALHRPALALLEDTADRLGEELPEVAAEQLLRGTPEVVGGPVVDERQPPAPVERIEGIADRAEDRGKPFM